MGHVPQPQQIRYQDSWFKKKFTVVPLLLGIFNFGKLNFIGALGIIMKESASYPSTSSP